jgi:hypothetical protein
MCPLLLIYFFDKSMKKSITLLTLPALVLGASLSVENPSSSDQPSPYAGFSIALASFTEEISAADDYETDHLLFGIRAGLKFNDYISGEFRFGKGDKDTTTWEGEFWKTKLDQYMGVYIKAHYPVDEHLNLYGLIGKTKLKYSESYIDPNPDFSFSYTENEQDTSLGLGLEYAISGSSIPMLISAEYVQYYDREDVSVNGLSLSALFEF